MRLESHRLITFCGIVLAFSVGCGDAPTSANAPTEMGLPPSDLGGQDVNVGQDLDQGTPDVPRPSQRTYQIFGSDFRTRSRTPCSIGDSRVAKSPR